MNKHLSVPPGVSNGELCGVASQARGSAWKRFALIFSLVLAAAGGLRAQNYYIPPPDFDGDGHANIMVVTPSSNPMDWKWRNKEGIFTEFIHGGPGDIALPADYDGDGIAEQAVFRPSTNTWYIWDTVTGMTSFVLGEAGSLPIIGDYDGDGKIDAAVLIPASFLGGMNVLKYRKSSDPTSPFVDIPIGIMGDVPVSGDFDGDGITDPAVFSPASRPGDSNVFIVQHSSTPDFEFVTELGGYGDVAVCADYTGDGITDLAVYQRDGTWLILPQGATQPIVENHGGHVNDIPIPGKYDGDALADLAVFRDGQWIIKRSNSYLADTIYQYYNLPPVMVGNPIWHDPIPGDWDGDGRTDIAVHARDFAEWYFHRSTAGGISHIYGAPTDTPVPADYDGDGIMDLGVYRESDSKWYLHRSSLGPAVVPYGYPGLLKIPADYDGDGKADFALIQPGAQLQWHIGPTSVPGTSFNYGSNGDVPVFADFNGNGAIDVGVFRPFTSTFYAFDILTGQGLEFQYGNSAMFPTPVPADYTGNGIAQPAVVYNDGTWLVHGLDNSIFSRLNTKPGQPVIGDYDGDGITDAGKFSAEGWWIRLSSTGEFLGQPGSFSFGVGSDVPSGWLTTGYDYNFNQPILLAPFDSTIVDLMGNTSLEAQNGASATSDTGILNGALELDGVNDYVTIPSFSYLNTSGPYLVRTISLWFRLDSLQDGRQMLYEEGADGRGFNIYVDNDTLYVGGWDQLIDSGIGDQEAWAGTWQQATLPDADVWYHATIMFDARQDPTQVTSGVFQAYLDGEEMSGSTQGMQVHTHSDAGALGYVSSGGTRMHDGATSVTNYLAGSLDELTVWNRVFDDTSYVNGVSEKELFFWMMNFFHHVNVDMDEDSDEDGLTNWQELQYGIDPTNIDTDGDGLTDGDEVYIYGTDPSNQDTDGDGLADGDEVHIYGTDPANSDTDGDGLKDGWEVQYGYSPLTNDGLTGAFGDLDGDRLANQTETEIGSSPTTVDTLTTLQSTHTVPGGDLSIILIGHGTFSVHETATSSQLLD